jgi:hypothetical protein
MANITTMNKKLKLGFSIMPIILAAIFLTPMTNLSASAQNSTQQQQQQFNQTTTTTNSSSNPVVKSIDVAISSLKSGDNNSGRKSLLQAESALEGNSKAVDAEKHIEASLQALKDGDTNGAINHAELAKKSLLGQ